MDSVVPRIEVARKQCLEVGRMLREKDAGTAQVIRVMRDVDNICLTTTQCLYESVRDEYLKYIKAQSPDYVKGQMLKAFYHCMADAAAKNHQTVAGYQIIFRADYLTGPALYGTLYAVRYGNLVAIDRTWAISFIASLADSFSYEAIAERAVNELLIAFGTDLKCEMVTL